MKLKDKHQAATAGLWAGRLGWAAAGLLLAQTPAFALSCDDQITQMTIDCMGGDLSKARACRDAAERQGCQAGGTDACEGEARRNVDWVFEDKGAHATYLGALNRGLSPLEAVIAAQGHNPPVQQQLRECGPSVEEYLASRGQATDPSPLSDRQLRSADCSCISVLPTGAAYQVVNGCDALNMSVQFVDAANTTRSTWVDAGILGNGQSAVVRAPGYAIPSINAAELRSASSALTCRF